MCKAYIEGEAFSYVWLEDMHVRSSQQQRADQKLHETEI